MQLCDHRDCTGCMTCFYVCRERAIDLYEDSEGFSRPRIKHELCTECGICTKSCPAMDGLPNENHDQRIFACWVIDEQTRKASSSGGLFSRLARQVIAKKGVVFGVGMNASLKACHMEVETEAGLSVLRGSKYVQSDISDSFSRVEHYVATGRTTLFSGTPCQVAGLKKFLGRDYQSLYTIDIICHGVPSPAVFEDYKKYIERNYGSGITSIAFRGKDYSWVCFNMDIGLVNGKRYIGKYYSDPWIRGFLRDNFIRPSCYRCRYASLNRVSDITIGDFWGYKGEKEDTHLEERGVSIAILNTEKGNALFDNCTEGMIVRESSVAEAILSNKTLSGPFPEPKTRDAFWADYRVLDFNELVKKWMRPEKFSFHNYIFNTYRINSLPVLLKAILLFERGVCGVYNRIKAFVRR